MVSKVGDFKMINLGIVGCSNLVYLSMIWHQEKLVICVFME